MDERPDDDAGITCPACASLNTADARACTHCGIAISGAYPSTHWGIVTGQRWSLTRSRRRPPKTIHVLGMFLIYVPIATVGVLSAYSLGAALRSPRRALTNDLPSVVLWAGVVWLTFIYGRNLWETTRDYFAWRRQRSSG